MKLIQPRRVIFGAVSFHKGGIRGDNNKNRRSIYSPSGSIYSFLFYRIEGSDCLVIGERADGD